MKPSIQYPTLMAFFILAQPDGLLAADSAERATATKEKIQALRTESAKTRNQINVTLEELSRLNVKGVDLRPQFERFKAELRKMENEARVAKDRADSMKQKGTASFQSWEMEVQTINNADIRKEAQKRYERRKKSYDKILAAMEDARDQLVPFMSDLNDVNKLLESELTEKSVASTKGLIKQANWHGEDVRESLVDVEKELDRVSAELAKYK